MREEISFKPFTCPGRGVLCPPSSNRGLREDQALQDLKCGFHALLSAPNHLRHLYRVRGLLGVLQIKGIRRSEAKGRETHRENFREVRTSLHMPLTTLCHLNPVPYLASSQLWEQVT